MRVLLCLGLVAAVGCAGGDAGPKSADQSGAGDTATIDDSGDGGDTVDSGATDSGDSADTGSGEDTGGVGSSVGSRVLVLGPSSTSPLQIAQQLQALLDHDSLDEDTVVQGIELPSPASTYTSQMTLMTAWYQHTEREGRRASFEGEWDHVLLLEAPGTTAPYPEFTFEGLRTLGGHFEASGARVHLVLEAPRSAFDTAVEHTYRVADGTGTHVIPAGLAAREVEGADDWAVVAATSAFSSLRGKSGSDSAVAIGALDVDAFHALADRLHADAEARLDAVYYTGDYVGPVQVHARDLPDAYGLMIAGTSSERNYLSTMETFLSQRGVSHHSAQLGRCDDYKRVDAECVDRAADFFATRPYTSLLARGYTVDHSDIVTAGGGDIQSQIYDRHWDATDNDGHNALDDLEVRMTWVLEAASDQGLSMLPFHLMFARYHELDPDVQMMNDGVHTTGDILYGIAAMSFHSATGQPVALDGLSETQQAIAAVGEDCIRQWSTLQEEP